MGKWIRFRMTLCISNGVNKCYRGLTQGDQIENLDVGPKGMGKSECSMQWQGVHKLHVFTTQPLEPLEKLHNNKLIFHFPCISNRYFQPPISFIKEKPLWTCNVRIVITPRIKLNQLFHVWYQCLLTDL